MKLLALCAQWHALAKLRMHNDLTLKLLDETTTLLADQFRTFVNTTCAEIRTVELAKEAAARARRAAKQAQVNVSQVATGLTSAGASNSRVQLESSGE
jgi:hypothetical protein